MSLIEFVIRNFTDINQTSNVNKITRPQRVVLRQVGGQKRTFVFPFGPQGVAFQGDALSYETTDRPGIKPVLTATKKELRTVTVTTALADKGTNGKASVGEDIETLQLIASEDQDCIFTYGAISLPYHVRITDIEFVAIRRALDGNITQSEVTFELTESVRLNQSVVTLTAITYEPDPVPADSQKTGGGGSGKTSSLTELDPDVLLPWNPNADPVYRTRKGQLVT